MRPSHASSLAGDLAVRRILYRSLMITAPSVLVIDVPAHRRGRGLALDRYYAMIIETEAEEQEVDVFLSAPRLVPVLPDLLDHRPSNLWTGTVLISWYEPPKAGWPWVSVARWPESYTSAAQARGIGMARGCYTMEMFETADALEAHQAALLENLAAQGHLSVRWLTPEMIGDAGTA